MRVVQAGLGSWGSGWLDVLRRGAGVEIAAVADPSGPAREAVRRRHGLGRSEVFDSLEGALDATGAEAVLIATPPDTHHDLAVAALRRGCHVLTEKPLATTMVDARSLVAAARETGRILMVSQNYRFRIPAATVREAVAGGVLGRLIHVSVSCRRAAGRTLPADDFRRRMRHPYVLDMMIHHADLLRAITGQDATEVVCRSWPVPGSGFDHHPAVSALMTLSDGTLVTYAGDWAAAGAETSWSGDWDMLGEGGRLTWRPGPVDDDVRSAVVRVGRSDEAPEAIPLAAFDAVDRDGTLQAFRRSVERGARVVTPAADNIRSLAMVLGCVASIESGAPVDVEALLAG